MIKITDNIIIDEREIQQQFIRSSGPGGQNVNKVETAVQLRFDVKKSQSLPDDVRRRLIRLAGKRINREGVLVITARRFRQQEKNRSEALRRLVGLIQKAAIKPRKRHKTRVPLASRLQRIVGKRHRSVRKNSRRQVKEYDE